ncbi:MAG: hypothetical protein MPK62_00380 [Alphaproteobacteria bacterium]|nr:hypothetical protein [Alphaproteobacteria bacterium]MDA8029594.1 hypothetical protein [Alphaproteobacteria bacterium]
MKGMGGGGRLTMTEVGMLVIAVSLAISAFSVDSFGKAKVDFCDTLAVGSVETDDPTKRSAELIEATLRCYQANSVELYKWLPVMMYGVAAVAFGAFMTSATRHGLFKRKPRTPKTPEDSKGN